MIQENADESPRWRICAAGGFLAALLFLAIWIPTHPARPHLPTSDLYTHLSVARHLVRGEGFLTDVTYPLSYAFPFAHELPQPLLHRQPGFAVLLTFPYLAGSEYPGRALDQVRWMQIILLGVLMGTGTAFLLRWKNRAAVIPWLVLLFFNPLLVFAVDWGMIELVCSLLLLVIWLRTRGPAATGPDGIDGLLAGSLAMLRLDLFWVPFFWWFFRRSRPLGRPVADRRFGLLLLMWLVMTVPWAVRNIQVTGQPVFSLQSYAEHVKDTRSWPGYSVYRQLTPQPVFETMTSDPVPVLRKAARGVKFYFREMPRLVPLTVLFGLVWGTLAYLLKRSGKSKIQGRGRGASSVPVAVLTVVMLSIQYAFFDHSLRHLLVVFPVLMWEVSAWMGRSTSHFLSHPDLRPHFFRARGMDIIVAAAASFVIILLFPCRVPGWESAARDAVTRAPALAQQIDEARGAPAGVLFVDSSAAPWFLDRPVVWSPADAETRARICDILGLPEANPGETP